MRICNLAVILCYLSIGLLASCLPVCADALTLSIGKGKTAVEFQVFKGEQEENVWYYLPVKPRVFALQDKGKSIPDISLVKFQKRNPEQPDELLEGGVLTFSLQLEASEEEEKQLLTLLKKTAGDCRLQAAPVTDVLLTIPDPRNEKPLASGGLTRGFASRAARSRVNLTVRLDKINAGIFEQLLLSDTGIPLHVTWMFTTWGNQMAVPSTATPPSTGEPNLVHRRQRNQETFFSSGFISLAEYAESIRNAAITIDSGNTLKQAWLVLPFVGDDPQMGIARVTIKLSLEARKDGIAGYGAQEFSWTPADPVWREKKSGKIFSLAEFDISSLAEKLPEEKLVQVEIKVANMIEFNWRNELGTLKTGRMKSFSMIPLFDGEIPIATPIEFVDIFSFNTASLSWSQTDEELSSLTGVDVQLINGRLEFRTLIQPLKLKNGTWSCPEENLVLLSKERTKPVEVKVYYCFKNGVRREWKNPYQLSYHESLIVDLFDEDCLETN